MRAVAKITWVELKLFFREPLTAVFTFALPLLLLFILGGVFGNTPDPEGAVYRGVGAMTYYVPAYVALVVASGGLVALPIHLAEYRERGVLRRLRASSIPLWTVMTSQVVVSLITALLGSLLLLAVAYPVNNLPAPVSLAGSLAAFLLGSVTFSSIGVLLGSLPTVRAAQGAGVMLWFTMMILGGTGPPPEVLTGAMSTVSNLTPLRHLVTLIQDPWLGLGWNWEEATVVLGVALLAAGAARFAFRWQ